MLRVLTVADLTPGRMLQASALIIHQVSNDPDEGWRESALYEGYSDFLTMY